MRALFCTVLFAYSAMVSADTKLDFKSVQVSGVIQMVYAEALTSPYVMDPDLLADKRLVSFRYHAKQGALRPFLNDFLASLGYRLTSRNGVDFITKRRDERDDDIFVYRPKFRSPAFLTEVLSPAIQGRFTLRRSISPSDGSATPADKSPPPGSAAAMVDHDGDLLIFAGSAAETTKLRTALQSIDVPSGEVVVRAVVYEVSTTRADGSAFSMLATILRSGMSITVGSADVLGTSLKFDTASFDAIYSALNQDSRFKVVSMPSLRIRSGQSGSFSVGEDVPTLGSVSYTSSGQPVQSVEYRSSGVIFKVRPTVRDKLIDLDVDQQMSSFSRTSTGVNSSPTLSKRSVATTVGVTDGSLVFLAGLSESRDNNFRDGLPFLPRLLHSRGSSESRSEILLMLQVQRI